MKKYFMKKKLVFFAASRAAGKGSPAGGSAPWRVFFLLLLLLCLPLSAAADDEEGSMPPTDGDRILLGSIGEASNLIPYLTADSASHEVADLLYVAPLRFNKDLEPECWAAESFSMEDEGRLLRFRLRKGILWEDGTELTAADVEFTYKMVIDPATGSPYADDFLQIKEFRVLDRYSFEVRYEHFFARAVSSWMNPILPRHILEGQNIRTTSFARKPVGAGPYRLQRWEPGVRIVLEASPTYFLGRPHISEVVFRIIPDTATMFMETRAGRLDVMELSPQQYLRQTSGKKWAESFHKYRYLASVYNFLGFNLEHPFFKDKKVRQAISCAINRGDIVKGVLLGLGEPAFGPYKPGTWAYHPGLRPVSFNPDRARKLLAEAGFTDSDGDGILDKDGKPLAFTIAHPHRHHHPEPAAGRGHRRAHPHRGMGRLHPGIREYRPLRCHHPGLDHHSGPGHLRGLAFLAGRARRPELHPLQEPRVGQGAGRGPLHAGPSAPDRAVPPGAGDPGRGSALLFPLCALCPACGAEPLHGHQTRPGGHHVQL